MAEWKEVPLTDLYDIGSGLSKPRSEFGFGYGFLTFKDVLDNYFVPDQLSALVNSTNRERVNCSVKTGDVFLTRTSETQDELGMSCVALKDYLCVPQHAKHTEPRAYPFTERRQEWIVDWVTKTYAADPERVTASGGSMGAWGSITYAFRHPERYSAVFPNRPRTRQRGLPSLLGGESPKAKTVPMDDGKTDYFTRMDMVKFATDHTDDLPFIGWCCGRRDGFATWQEQVDMVKALASAKHGFAFAWNDGDHGTGAQPMAQVVKFYPPELFARNKSYPAFRNSSLDQKPGNGDPKDGDLEGGINLGFRWSEIVDEETKWSVQLSNGLAKNDMTVDVTPRRCQKFKVRTGTEVRWTTSNGDSGKVTADTVGLVTIPGDFVGRFTAVRWFRFSVDVWRPATGSFPRPFPRWYSGASGGRGRPR